MYTYIIFVSICKVNNNWHLPDKLSPKVPSAEKQDVKDALSINFFCHNRSLCISIGSIKR